MAGFGDFSQPFRIEDLGLRGRLVRLGPALEAIVGPHGYPVSVAEMLGEAVALAATLADSLRFEGTLKLQTQGDGPIPMMVVDARSDGGLRGYARFDEGRIATATGGSPVPRLLGAGRMAVTVDHGPAATRYQGITELTGARLADCAHTYFRQSEPVETAIALASVANGTGSRAAGLMIQRVPPGGDTVAAEEEDDAWRGAVALTGSVTEAEMLDPGLAPEALLYRLYHEHGVRLYRTRALRPVCTCSREKVAETLSRFAPGEIAEMAENGRITVTCEFCKRDYVFEWPDPDGRPVS